MTEHSINRSGTAENRTDDHDSEQDADDSRDDADRSEAEIKRELRKSAIGQAIIEYDRQQRR